MTTETGAEPLDGLRILIVEDEATIALLLEDMLTELGCSVVASAGRLAKALDLAQRESFDIAILDVNLAGEAIYPVAEALTRRGLPFVFSTGYGSAGLHDTYRKRPVLQKPFALHELRRILLASLPAPASRESGEAEPSG